MNFCWRKKNPILNIDLLVSQVFDQYFSSHCHYSANVNKEEKDFLQPLLLSHQNNNREEVDLYHHQLQGESKKINKKERRLPSSSSSTDTKNHFSLSRQKPPPQPVVKLTTDLVARVSVEEFLETNPTVDQFLRFQKCKMLINQISKHQQQQDLYLDQADSDCPSGPSTTAENKVFQYKSLHC
jgi:hypothetical protein